MDPGERTKHLQHEASDQRVRERERAAARIQAGERPWEHEKGVLAVVDAVRDLEFPLRRDDIASQAGDRYLQASERLVLPMAEVVEHLPENEFLSIRDFQTAVQKHWQGIRFLETPEEQRSPEGGFQPTQRGDWPHHAGKTPRDNSPRGD